MCGINGIFAYHYAANPADTAELIRTREAQAARGPDGAGLYVSADGRLALGHRRLAIIDLAARADQPMSDVERQTHLVYNGEIYNYRELRAAYARRGYRFVTESDSEVLLAGYALDGIGFVGQLRGMYAFALYDAAQQQLWLVRDPYGIKPLYFHDDGWTLRFASQARALIAGGAIAERIEPAAAVGFLLWGSVPGTRSWYAGVEELPAGSLMRVDALGPASPRIHGDVLDALKVKAQSAPAEAEVAQVVREALIDSVEQHLVADVSVGVFLSAGIDSAVLVGLMAQLGLSPQALTLGFTEYAGLHADEAPLARRIAAHYGASHSVQTLSFADFEDALPHFLAAMDQPSIDGLNTYLVARACRAQGLKVALSGVGGDEIFGGYPSFASLPRWRRLLWLPGRTPALGWFVERWLRFLLPKLGIPAKAASMLRHGGSWQGLYRLRRGLYLPAELHALLPTEFVRDGLARLRDEQPAESALLALRGDYRRVVALESTGYMRRQLLRDADWASMAHGLELRTPLVDIELLRRLAPLLHLFPVDGRKRLLAGAPAKPLPEAVLNRAKTGFQTPAAQWLAQIERWPTADGHWSRGYARAIAARRGLKAA